jgi:hypothetical protein
VHRFSTDIGDKAVDGAECPRFDHNACTAGSAVRAVGRLAPIGQGRRIRRAARGQLRLGAAWLGAVAGNVSGVRADRSHGRRWKALADDDLGAAGARS